MTERGVAGNGLNRAWILAKDTTVEIRLPVSRLGA